MTVVKFKPCPVQLSLKIAENDKDKMAETVISSQSSVNTIVTSPEPVELDEGDNKQLPSLKHSHVDSEGWTTFEEPILYVYGGKGPYVGRYLRFDLSFRSQLTTFHSDFMAFPVSLPNDGLVDVMAMARVMNISYHDHHLTLNTLVVFQNRRCCCHGWRTKRRRLLAPPRMSFSFRDKASNHPTFLLSKIHYVKAHAYRIKPLEKRGYLSVDGEPYPFEEFHVEVHEGLGAFLSPYGHYAARFEPRKPTSATQTQPK